MALPLTLPTAPLEHPAMDYASLRQEGIRLLERLGAEGWTDFNTHDPGITILEQLCYAITDLAYRTSYDLKDILFDQNGSYRSLHTPAQVLTTNPVTLTDLRKLLIDVPGVKNAWLEPVGKVEPGLMSDPSENSLYLETSSPQPPQRQPLALRGLYAVLLEADNSQAGLAAYILPEANRRLQACRTLAEDFLPPVVLQGQKIVVSADIEINPVDDPDQLLASIYAALDRAISPKIHFHTLAERLAQGKSMDEIMDGPALLHGFIDDAELDQFERKMGLRTSDLIQALMQVEGVLTIRSIRVADEIHSEDWYLKLDPSRTPFLDVSSSLFSPGGPTIRLLRGGIGVQVKPARANDLLDRLRQADITPPLSESQRDLRLPAGRDRSIGRYTSIQNQFPEAYGIGAIGLPDSASALRKAQARQLQAYLLFFDQLLANSFAQLGNARELFSFDNRELATYFSQIVEDAGLGLEAIHANDPATHAANIQEYTLASALGLEAFDPSNPAAAERKNRFLNHLLARYAEQFTDYSLLSYARLGSQDLIDDKSAFLSDYQHIGAARGSGFNIAQPGWGTDNVSGVEKRISRKLGISSYTRRDLAGIGSADEGGFHMLEHILLRPNLADNQQWAQAAAGASWQAAGYLAAPASADPYSHQVSFIFPKWVERLNDPGFTDLVAKTLREETPAHIRVSLHWLAPDEMQAFEAAYKTWLEQVIAGRLWNPIEVHPDDDLNHMIYLKLRDARDRMVQILGIGLPYPLRDLPLAYPAMIAYNRPAAIQIRGGQSGVLYQLCDEDGNPILANGSGFEVRPDAAMADSGVLLPTPAITQDITFTILAVREDLARDLRLESYLNQQVSLKVGIDPSLPLGFVPAGNQVASGSKITVDYNDTLNVTVDGTQEGISYKLILGPLDAPTSISQPQKGNLGKITLVSNQAFSEDATLYVQAYRTAATKVTAILDASLTVLVRPNPAVTFTLSAAVLDYGSSASFALNSPQASVEYRLYRRELVPGEYLAAPAGNLTIQGEEGRQVFILIPAPVTDWSAPAGFTPAGLFEQANGSLSANSGALAEDTLFVVQATKIANREQLQLTQTAAILVRPDPSPLVDVQAAAVESGQAGMVRLQNTQKGVAYQLRLDADNSPVNPPGYHLSDRGIETMRVDVDLTVEDPGQPILLLPTGILTQATSFNVLARKILTGLSAQLSAKAQIDVQDQPGA